MSTLSLAASGIVGPRIVNPIEAARLIPDGSTVLIGGAAGGHAVPETVLAAIESLFLEGGRPSGLTTLHSCGIGDGLHRGVGRLAHEGLIRKAICSAVIDSPKVAEMAERNLIELHTLPQGVISLLIREMSGGRPGVFTKTGLGTFIDPRHGGGCQTPPSNDPLVRLMEIAGEEWLFFPSMHVDVALIRGTTIDARGNLSMEEESVFSEMLSIAQAARRSGGIVIAQAKRRVDYGLIPGKSVKVPGFLIDYAVICPNEPQTYKTVYNPSYSGEVRLNFEAVQGMPFGIRKVVARRAARELSVGAVCNIGTGICTGIPAVAAQMGLLDQVTLTTDQGLVGGLPATDGEDGAASSFEAMLDQPYIFDIYDGGSLDIAFLSFAEIDEEGSVNVSRFGGRIIGVGGFTHLAQWARKLVFCGTLTAGGLDVAYDAGATRIVTEGRVRKFVRSVQQKSYAGSWGDDRQDIVVVTERAVFRRRSGRLVLTEIAPGVDPARDVLPQIDFGVEVAADLKTMDTEFFRP